jgi:hypothetical protein
MITRFLSCPLGQRKSYHRQKYVLIAAAALTLIAMTLTACTHTTATPAGDPAVGGPILSENGRFLVSYRAETPPIALNATHSWLLTVQTPAGEPVSGATIAVDGGMPAHNHGLPTQPQAAAADAPGDYRVEGVRFQMPGEWVVTFTIQAGDISDQVTFPLALR